MKLPLEDRYRPGLVFAVALTAVSDSLEPDSPSGDRITIHGGEADAGVAVGLRLSDADVEALADRVPIGAPVFIET